LILNKSILNKSALEAGGPARESVVLLEEIFDWLEELV
jgi:hypothetical protein